MEHKNQIIFYNDEEMQCYNVFGCEFKQDNFYFNEPTRSSNFSVSGFIARPVSTFDLQVNKQKIELDPTLMKRIAKYNAEVEVEELKLEKARLEEQIEELKELEKKHFEKIEDMKKFCEKFMRDSYDTVEEYAERYFAGCSCDDEYYDYNDEDDDE